MATYTKEKDVATTQEDDSEARTAMEEVFGNTARWPEGFAGFTGDVVVNINGKEESGTVTAKNVKEIETTLQGTYEKETYSCECAICEKEIDVKMGYFPYCLQGYCKGCWKAHGSIIMAVEAKRIEAPKSIFELLFKGVA